MSVSTPSPAGRKKPTNIHQAYILSLLVAHREDCDRQRRERIHIITLARRNGLTYAQIGDALGVTEAAVRFYVKRNGAGA